MESLIFSFRDNITQIAHKILIIGPQLQFSVGLITAEQKMK